MEEGGRDIPSNKNKSSGELHLENGENRKLINKKGGGKLYQVPNEWAGGGYLLLEEHHQKNTRPFASLKNNIKGRKEDGPIFREFQKKCGHNRRKNGAVVWALCIVS